MKISNEITKVQYVIRAKLLDHMGVLDMHAIAKLALKLTDIRKNQMITHNQLDSKESTNILTKFDELLGKVKSKLCEEHLEKYQTPEEALAAQDALMLLCCIANKYKTIQTMHISLSDFFDERMIKEIEIVGQISSTLSHVKKAATKGKWDAPNGVKQLLANEHLYTVLGHMYSMENEELARMLCFAAINTAINPDQSNLDKIIECAGEFIVLYPTLVAKMALFHPEYFVNNSTVKAMCLENEAVTEMISILRPSSLEPMLLVDLTGNVTDLSSEWVTQITYPIFK